MGASDKLLLPPTAAEADRNGSRLDNQGGTEEPEDLTYDFVPPKKSVTLSVRYRIRGRGKPLPYPLDEGDGQ
jgi:hypothetical protein